MYDVILLCYGAKRWAKCVPTTWPRKILENRCLLENFLKSLQNIFYFLVYLSFLESIYAYGPLLIYPFFFFTYLVYQAAKNIFCARPAPVNVIIPHPRTTKGYAKTLSALKVTVT